MKPHSDTVKQYPRHTDNTQHNTNTTHNKLVLAKVGFGQSRFWPKSVLAKVGLAKVGSAKVGFGQSRFWPKSVWPKSVSAKVGHTTKTLTLAKVGLAKLGSKKGWPKSAMTEAALPKEEKRESTITQKVEK